MVVGAVAVTVTNGVVDVEFVGVASGHDAVDVAVVGPVVVKTTVEVAVVVVFVIVGEWIAGSVMRDIDPTHANEEKLQEILQTPLDFVMLEGLLLKALLLQPRVGELN